jgi:integrase
MPQKQKQEKYNRTANGTGSIFKRSSDGRYVGQILVGYRADGSADRKNVYGKSEKEVKVKLEELKAQIKQGLFVTKRNSDTLGGLIKSWLKTNKRNKKSPRTYEWYCNMSKRIIAELGDVHVSKLNRIQIQNFLDDTFEKEGLSVRYIKALRDILNQVLNQAVDDKIIPENPARKTVLPKERRKKNFDDDGAKAMSIEVRQKVLEATANDKLYKPIVYTLLFTGIRAGEFLALPWKNVDLKNSTVIIDQAVTLDVEIDDDLNPISRSSIVDLTKTITSERKIKIPKVLVDILTEWKHQQENHKKHRNLTDPERPVFPNKYGEMRTYNGFRRTFQRFFAKHGLSEHETTLHSFRHTFATMLLEAGVNPKIVQTYLGHKDIETTLNLYSHVLKEVYDGAALTLEEICSKTLDGTFTPLIGTIETVRVPHVS